MTESSNKTSWGLMLSLLVASLWLVAAAQLLTVAGCAVENKVTGSPDGDADTDSDSDTDVDSDSDSDTGCVPGDDYCVDNDVYHCSDAGEPEFVETCPSPLVCSDGACIDTGACAQAVDDVSTEGCEFWAIDMANVFAAKNLPYAVVVGNLDEATVHVTAEVRTDSGYLAVDEADLQGHETHIFMLTGSSVAISPQLQTVDGTYLLEDQAYRITSDLPIVAYQFNPYASAGGATNDGTVLFPTPALGDTYLVMGYRTTLGGQSSLNIIATEDETEIKVTPSSPIHPGGTVPALATGEEVTFVMDAAGVLQLNTSGDVTGTFVESDKPVAVFGGNLCSFVPDGFGWCDHLEHQVPPISTWGDEVVAARSVIRSESADPENDIWRIIAAEDDTVVTTSPLVPGVPGVMNAGQTVEVAVDHSFLVSANGPILVGQFIAGQEATGIPDPLPGGDPAFALLAPVDQFRADYAFLAPDTYAMDYVVITHPSGLEVLLDDEATSEIAGCEVEDLDVDWQITRCEIEDFSHTIDATQPVGITVWGYDYAVSYGYAGGHAMEPINVE